MKKKKIIITAANGFLGKELGLFLREKYEVIGLVRSSHTELVDGLRYVQWDGKSLGDWQQEFEGAFAVINMAGRSVDCRYNEKNKNDIIESRRESTMVVGQAIDLCENKPKIWMNAASATIYRHSEDKAMGEESIEFGSGFSVDVCKMWEKTFFDFTYKNVRQLALRTTIVLGKNGGALHPMRQLAKFGLGGKQGKGTQMFSWIHIQDFCEAVQFMLDDVNMSGLVNMAAPEPVTNAVFMKMMRNAVGRYFGLPTPKFLLELGARIIKTETELILKSRFVIPEKLQSHGFEFEFSSADKALKDLV